MRKQMPTLNRRTLLSRGSGAVSLCFISGASIPVGLSSAQAPAPGYIAIAQLALQVLSLGNRSKSGIGELLSLQTEFLRSISSQISVVQSSLDQVFNDILEIKEIVRKIPSATVVEIYKAEISGALRNFGEVSLTYTDDSNKYGIEYAQKSNRVELEEIISTIRKARNILFGIDNEFNIPVLSSSMYTEINAMIMIGERDSRLVNAVSSYRDWMQNWLSRGDGLSLASQISKARKSAQTAKAALAGTTGKNAGTYCTQYHLQIAGSKITVTSDKDYELIAMKEAPKVFEQFSGLVADLMESGVAVPQHDRVLTGTLLSTRKLENRFVGRPWQEVKAIISRGEARLTTYCDPIQGHNRPHLFTQMQRILRKSEAEMARLQVARDKLITYHSIDAVASDSADFASRFHNEIAQPPQ